MAVGAGHQRPSVAGPDPAPLLLFLSLYSFSHATATSSSGHGPAHPLGWERLRHRGISRKRRRRASLRRCARPPEGERAAVERLCCGARYTESACREEAAATLLLLERRENGHDGTGSRRRRWTKVVVAVVIVVAVLAGGCGLLLWKCRRRIKEKLGIVGMQKTKTQPSLLPLREARQDLSGPKQPDQEEAEGGGKKCELPLFSLETVAAATGDFSADNKLGEGGFGHVYKGRLPGGEEVAVKRLSRGSGQGQEEFKNEVILIAKLQHRNLVKLLGCCIQGEEKILVYEYMPNKSLDAFLFDPSRRGLLDWKTRFHIIEGIARGLLYLHRDSRLRVVHRDLKASNILLDRDMNPKISDFGMARIFGGDHDQNHQVNTDRVVGTLGYMSPEYAMEGLFSVRSDVYSFGILILEIVSGQKNSSFHHMEGSLNIVGYAWQLWSAGRGERLVDPAVLPACPVREALRCVHMALLCVQDHANDRPDIPYVVMALGSDSSVLPMPKPPTFTLQCTSSDRDGLFPFPDRVDESYSACDLTVTMLQGR